MYEVGFTRDTIYVCKLLESMAKSEDSLKSETPITPLRS